MPKPLHPFAPASRVLRLSGLAPGQLDACADLLGATGLSVVPLPESPPTEPEILRQTVRQTRFVLIDLDQPTALAWVKTLRERHPVLPVIATFARGDLAGLLAASSLGLDGALRLPAEPEKIAATLAPWLPTAPSAPPSARHSDDTVLLAPRERRLTATHLSAESDANQAVLRAIDTQTAATRFLTTGPVGAEFSLLAQELAARRGVATTDIALPGLPPPTRVGLFVTEDLGAFMRSAAPLSLLVLPGAAAVGEATASGRECVRLSLKPLHTRPADLAHYLRRWLPEIFLANHREDPAFPLSPAWRHTFLAHDWPGEFRELYRAMHRFGLLPAGEAPPPGFLAPAPAAPSFESVAAIQIPRSYRTRLSRRIPADLLPSALSLLGYPEPPSARHE